MWRKERGERIRKERDWRDGRAHKTQINPDIADHYFPHNHDGYDRIEKSRLCGWKRQNPLKSGRLAIWRNLIAGSVLVFLLSALSVMYGTSFAAVLFCSEEKLCVCVCACEMCVCDVCVSVCLCLSMCVSV